MHNYKRTFFYAGVVIWFFLTTTLILYNFFPYQKLIKVTFQSLLCGSKMVVSIEGAKIRSTGARVSKMVFGHEALKDKPLFEIEKVNIFFNPLSIAGGVLSLRSNASAYGGSLKLNIDGIPAFRNSIPSMKIDFTKVNFSQYPENRLPWFKGISGVMNGWVKKEMPPLTPEKQKGSFAVNIQNGEIKEIQVKNAPKFSLPYKDITIEGKIDGDTIRLSKISINSMGNIINGTGSIETNDFEQKIDLKLTYEATSKGAPLSGKGMITVSGNQWLTDINVIPASQDKTDAKK